MPKNFPSTLPPALLQWLGLGEKQCAVSEQRFRILLTQKIAELLQEPPAVWAEVFYRFDVPEAEVRSVLQSRPEPQWPELLADLVWDRGVQKWARQTRWQGHFSVPNSGREFEG